jgi:hypothetical protein
VRVFGTSSAVDIVQGSNGTSQRNTKGALELAVLVMTLLAFLMAL